MQRASMHTAGLCLLCLFWINNVQQCIAALQTVSRKVCPQLEWVHVGVALVWPLAALHVLL